TLCGSRQDAHLFFGQDDMRHDSPPSPSLPRGLAGSQSPASKAEKGCPNMQIDYLADHLDFAPLLAAWHHREWADLLPGWSLEHAEAELRSHTERRRIPTTFVALDGCHPVGSV